MTTPLTLTQGVAAVLLMMLAPTCGRENAKKLVINSGDIWGPALARAEAGENTFFVIGDFGWPDVGVIAGTEAEVIERLGGRRGMSVSLNLALSRARDLYRRTLQ